MKRNICWDRINEHVMNIKNKFFYEKTIKSVVWVSANSLHTRARSRRQSKKNENLKRSEKRASSDFNFFIYAMMRCDVNLSGCVTLNEDICSDNARWFCLLSFFGGGGAFACAHRVFQSSMLVFSFLSLIHLLHATLKSHSSFADSDFGLK